MCSSDLMKLLISVLLFKSLEVNAVIVGSIIACILFSSIALNYLTSRLLNEDFRKKLRLLTLTLLIVAAFYLTDEGMLRTLLYTIIVVFVASIFAIRERQNLKLIYSKLPGFSRLNGSRSTLLEE